MVDPEHTRRLEERDRAFALRAQQEADRVFAGRTIARVEVQLNGDRISGLRFVFDDGTPSVVVDYFVGHGDSGMLVEGMTPPEP